MNRSSFLKSIAASFVAFFAGARMTSATPRSRAEYDAAKMVRFSEAYGMGSTAYGEMLRQRALAANCPFEAAKARMREDLEIQREQSRLQAEIESQYSEPLNADELRMSLARDIQVIPLADAKCVEGDIIDVFGYDAYRQLTEYRTGASAGAIDHPMISRYISTPFFGTPLDGIRVGGVWFKPMSPAEAAEASKTFDHRFDIGGEVHERAVASLRTL